MSRILFATVVAFLTTGSFAKLPADIEPCQYEDTLCVIRIAGDLINNYPHGRSDMGLPPLDPYRTESIVMDEGDNRTFSFDLRFKDVEVRGISAMKPEKAVGFGKNPAKSKFELYAKVPRLEITGNYAAAGRILFLPIEGNGTFSVIVENIKGALKFRPKVIQRNSGEYLKIDKIKIRLEPEKASINLTNLFNGNEQLSKAVLDFVNENWSEVWKELSQPIVGVAEKTAKDIMQNIFDKYSYSDFFINGSD